jgi:hypothetical protein
MFWADSFGAKYIHSKLEQWTKQYGNFFKPCDYLAKRAARGISLVQISLSTLFFCFACKFYIYWTIFIDSIQNI